MTPLPDYSEALAMALRAVMPITRVEEFSIEDAGGRTLAEEVVADRDLPPFNRAMMDGYAIRSSDFAPGVRWPVVATVAAGASPDVRVPQGSCVAIATGAALPAEVDTVIQHELSDRADPVQFSIQSIERGQAVHPCGADARRGQVVLRSSTYLAAQHLGIAASVGRTRLKVFGKPRVAVLTSGDEVVAPGTATSQLLPHQIRNSNGIMVAELVKRVAAQLVSSVHVADDLDQTKHAVADALAASDLVITIGGVSAGERDYFPDAFETHRVVMHLQGAAIQPGRPIAVGRTSQGQVVIALPGNPVSALACACLFVWPTILAMMGVTSELLWQTVQLAEPVKPNERRRAFRPAVMQNDRKVLVPAWAGSGDLSHTAATHGLLELPVQSDVVAVGTMLRFLPWP